MPTFEEIWPNPGLVETAAPIRETGRVGRGTRKALDTAWRPESHCRGRHYAHLLKDENVADPARSAAFERAVTAAIQRARRWPLQPELLQIPKTAMPNSGRARIAALFAMRSKTAAPQRP